MIADATKGCDQVMLQTLKSDTQCIESDLETHLYIKQNPQKKNVVARRHELRFSYHRLIVLIPMSLGEPLSFSEQGCSALKIGDEQANTALASSLRHMVV